MTDQPDQPKKPKDIKDLKARLGRTITPGTQKPSISVPTSGAQTGGIGAEGPAAAPRVPPPVVAPPLGGAAIPGLPLPAVGVAPPPFFQAAAAPQQAQSSNPFATSAAPAAQEVRLVIDDNTTPIDETETGRQSRSRVYIVLGIGILVGLAVGYGGGSINGGRRAYNDAVRDGREIFHIVDAASQKIETAGRQLRTLSEKAAPTLPGAAPAVDFDAISALRAIERPFPANAFANKNYSEFSADGVDALFDFYNKTNMLWDRFERLAARTLPPQRREELTRSLQASTELSANQYGLVARSEGERFFGSLVYVSPIEGNAAKVRARTSRGSVNAVELTPWQGQSLQEDAQSYVILLDTATSAEILGQSANAFQEYAVQLREIQELYQQTNQARGLLQEKIGSVATLEEIFAL